MPHAADCEGTCVPARAAYNTKMGRNRWQTRIAVAMLLVALGAAAVSAQRRGRGRFFEAVKSPTPDTFQGSFNFCRIMFSMAPDGDGGGWYVDYPRADVNLSIRLSELTKTRISTDASGEPDHVVIALTDAALFECPIVMMTEVGNAYIAPQEAVKLREYLEKGGFLWADDFWGSYAWEHWEQELGKVLPPNEYKIFELPKDHPIFRQQFQIASVTQIASINHWASYGNTSERGADSAVPHAMGVADKQGRLMVLMTHNTDFGDSWEREGDDPTYFYNFSVPGYAFGINVLLYALSH